MLVTVLKAFDYSHDGMRVQPLQKGDPVEVRDELFDGLFGAGFIDDGAEIGAAVGAEVPIPEGWEALELPGLKALAAAITGQTPTTKAKALEAIKAELARRGAA